MVAKCVCACLSFTWISEKNQEFICKPFAEIKYTLAAILEKCTRVCLETAASGFQNDWICTMYRESSTYEALLML